jgi:hypothetical protein
VSNVEDATDVEGAASATNPSLSRIVTTPVSSPIGAPRRS